jgi:hypothetical protein
MYIASRCRTERLSIDVLGQIRAGPAHSHFRREPVNTKPTVDLAPRYSIQIVQSYSITIILLSLLRYLACSDSCMLIAASAELSDPRLHRKHLFQYYFIHLNRLARQAEAHVHGRPSRCLRGQQVQAAAAAVPYWVAYGGR